MRNGFVRTSYRYYLRILNLILNNGTNFIVLIALVTTLAFKIAKYVQSGESKGGIFIDYYQAQPRLMIHEYNANMINDR